MFRLYRRIAALEQEVENLKNANRFLMTRMTLQERTLARMQLKAEYPIRVVGHQWKQIIPGCGYCGSDDHSSGACAHKPAGPCPL